MEAICSMVYWDEEFCQQLADTGRYVIRYDNRDVGRSTTYEPGSSHYTVVDMADDAIGVLDAYHIDEAHIVGMSLGGMIAQIVALRNPQRVLSKTLIASGIFGSEDNDRNLPPIDEKILAYHANAVKDKYTKGKVVEGTIGSADLWNNEVDRIKWFHTKYGTSVEEMEGAAAAQIANAYDVPFLGIRVLSNNKTNGGKYNPNTAAANQEYVYEVVKKYIDSILNK
ncbi:alpha/beta fold hydrolase [Bacillus cereus]|nr:alpha/beta fold hydrolase [Bacillus cereus]MBE7097253.1 alpha/beta fold hydrolase [Bacillus cereus]